VRVGLNATCFNDRPSGARQRFAGIYGALIARRPDIEFVVFEPTDCRTSSWFPYAPNVTARRTPLPSEGRLRRTIGGLRYWRSALAREELDLFEHFHLPLVRAPNCPTILTVHDARPVLPEIPLLKRMLYGAVLRSGLRRADHVVTVSQTMKSELLRLDARSRITTIYNGIDPAPFHEAPPDRAERTRARFGLAPGFILAVGHIEERKNYLRLTTAMALLRDRGRPVPLVIVGNDGGQGDRLASHIAQLGMSAQISLLRGVSDAELADLYALSRLVVFPSYYEGFGIPILEAMAAHRPLILSDTAVFRELTEQRLSYFPPGDAGAIADAIASLLDRPDVQREFVDYGSQRVSAFGFSALSRQVEAVYEAALRTARSAA
jgi:glycosyltransferase involved in cell wall biosynthesis